MFLLLLVKVLKSICKNSEDDFKKILGRGLSAEWDHAADQSSNPISTTTIIPSKHETGNK